MDSKSMREVLTNPYQTAQDLALPQRCDGFNHTKSLLSEVGDLQKTSDKLMFALMSLKFPSEYAEDLALQGHPTIFMKILHYCLFFSSKIVTNYLYTRDIEPNTVYLNDYKFMERVMFITINILGIKPRISLKQFFKYGFAEQKMMMCVDTIKRVQQLTRQIKINQSLNSSRKLTSRKQSAPRFLNSSVKISRGKTLSEVQESMKHDFETQQVKQAKKILENKSQTSNLRTKQQAIECSMRLIGSSEFQTVNRHRHVADHQTAQDKEKSQIRSKSGKKSKSVTKLSKCLKTTQLDYQPIANNTNYNNETIGSTKIAIDETAGNHTATHQLTSNLNNDINNEIESPQFDDIQQEQDQQQIYEDAQDSENAPNQIFLAQKNLNLSTFGKEQDDDLERQNEEEVIQIKQKNQFFQSANFENDETGESNLFQQQFQATDGFFSLTQTAAAEKMVILNQEKKQEELMSITECNIQKEDSQKIDKSGNINQIQLLLQLKQQIEMIDSRMSTFESTFSSKIDTLQNNYQQLNEKLSNIQQN